VSDLHPAFLATGTAPDAAPIWCVDAETWPALRERLTPAERSFADAAGFKPEPGNHLLLSGADGSVAGVLFAIDPAAKRGANPFLPGSSPAFCPRAAGASPRRRPIRGSQHLPSRSGPIGSRATANPKPKTSSSNCRTASMARNSRASLKPSFSCAISSIRRRTIAARLNSKPLARHRRALWSNVPLGRRRQPDSAKIFPLVHAVGRASVRAPRLIEFSWGDAKHPKVALVGKGVCFDTGGLDIKTSAGMLLMKKDMGGAAHALGLRWHDHGRGTAGPAACCHSRR
jgi:leucyl aminopeptidase